MKLDLSNNVDLNKFNVYCSKLIDGGKKVELKEIRPKRSLSQNNYAHVVFSLFGIYHGYSILEVKTLVKRSNGNYYEKNGTKFLKSTADMDSGELTDLIEFTRNMSAKEGHYIPTSEEYLQNRFNIDREIEQNKEHLNHAL